MAGHYEKTATTTSSLARESGRRDCGRAMHGDVAEEVHPHWPRERSIGLSFVAALRLLLLVAVMVSGILWPPGPPFASECKPLLRAALALAIAARIALAFPLEARRLTPCLALLATLSGRTPGLPGATRNL